MSKMHKYSLIKLCMYPKVFSLILLTLILKTSNDIIY